MPRGHRLRTNPQSLRRAGAKIMQHDIGLGEQAVQRRHPFRRFQIKRDGFLAAIEFVEIQRITMAKIGAHTARIIAAIGFFHLDHISAKVSENGARERPGQHLAKLHHAHTSKDTIHCNSIPASRTRRFHFSISAA